MLGGPSKLETAQSCPARGKMSLGSIEDEMQALRGLPTWLKIALSSVQASELSREA